MILRYQKQVEQMDPDEFGYLAESSWVFNRLYSGTKFTMRTGKKVVLPNVPKRFILLEVTILVRRPVRRLQQLNRRFLLGQDKSWRKRSQVQGRNMSRINWLLLNLLVFHLGFLLGLGGFLLDDSQFYIYTLATKSRHSQLGGCLSHYQWLANRFFGHLLLFDIFSLELGSFICQSLMHPLELEVNIMLFFSVFYRAKRLSPSTIFQFSSSFFHKLQEVFY